MAGILPVGDPEAGTLTVPEFTCRCCVRIPDFDLAVGHLWHCDQCRRSFLENPASIMIGLKLDAAQRSTLHKLAANPDTLLDQLQHVWPMDDAAFQRAISHPRARLRHLGSIRSAHATGGRS